MDSSRERIRSVPYSRSVWSKHPGLAPVALTGCPHETIFHHAAGCALCETEPLFAQLSELISGEAESGNTATL